jgi:ADP-dependent NAD(P)H-hydrate dehydratase / NAD(P)H-hydrate epimerase
MRRAHTVEQVRTAEADLMAALPPGTLMRRAAAGLASACLDYLGHGYGARICLLVGSGDNGGDTLFAGAALARRGARVEAVLLTERAHEAGLTALTAAGGRVVTAASAVSSPVDLLLDGIVGIGGRPGLRDNAVAALESLAGTPVVAVDVPSGIDVDTGETPDRHVRADLTVTFGTHKVGLLVGPGAVAAGVVHLVDIGLELPAAPVESLQAADVNALLPWPDPAMHKYSRGVVGVAVGSEAYPGAAVLTVAGALAGCTGMVRFIGDAEVTHMVRQAHPEVVAGRGRVQAWVVGPGGGDSAGTALKTAAADGVPLLVDADGLPHVHGPLGPPALLTPHAGELARMLGTERDDVDRRPLHHARAAAERFAATVLLKGARTLVVTPDGRARVNATGVPWLASAGAGDVLSGLCGSLLAAGLSPFDAGSVGAWLHGAAAALASGGGPITAVDVAAAVPAVIADLAA